VAEFFDHYESMRDDEQEIEALVRAAGGFVRASDDLRPRVLETIRLQRGERRAQGHIRRAALLCAIFAMLTAAFPPTTGLPARWQQSAWLTPSTASLLLPAQASATSGGDVAWNLVDALTELRRRQASVFNNSP
jgi:hypothetical protein